MPSTSVFDTVTPSESVTLSFNPLGSASDSIIAHGRVILDGILFTSDPDTYSANWEKRISVHQVLGGVVIQNFGRFAKDKVITLSSGAALLDNEVAYQLDVRAQTLDTVYNFRDWLNNEFIVYILNFKAVPHFVGPLYSYEMTLQVLTIIRWYGVTYSGS